MSPKAGASTATSSRIRYAGRHGRILCPDNNSEGWLIQDNVIRVTSDITGSDAVYGIRYRGTEAPANCGGDHVIDHNTVDCSTATGAGSCFPISIGDDPGGDECGNVDIRYNLLVSGDSPALSFYSGSVTDQDIYCNRVESLGVPIGIVGQPTDIRFSLDGGVIVSDAAEPLDGSAVADGGATARDGVTEGDAGRGPDAGRSESGASDGCSCRVTGRGARAAHGLTLVLAAAAALWRGRRASRSKTRQ